MAIGQKDTSILNSKYDERNPVLSPDGKTLFFVRKFHPENAGGVKDPGDIWISSLVNGQWTQPVNAGSKINTKYFNGVIGYKEEQTIYVYGHYTPDGSKPKTQGISRTTYVNGVWSDPVIVPVEYFMNKSEDESISLSADGSIMVMSLESFGSYGEEDLYVSFLRPDGKWSQPKNLGYGLNTTAQEFTPYLAPDNVTLYFSSNGYEGLGSKDIYVTTRLDDTWQHWSEPKNLGSSVNSVGMELSFLPISSDMAYFISTQNSDGYGDVKMKKIEPQLIKGIGIEPQVVSNEPRLDLSNLPEIRSESKIVAVFGRVTNRENQEPLEVNISVSSDGFSEEFENEKDGAYKIELPKGKVYELVFGAQGFLSRSEEVDLTQGEEFMELPVVLYPIELGATINLEGVNFYRGTADLIESSFRQLGIVVQLLKDNPTMEIELSGHTDNQGDPRLNLRLSQDRVEKVKEYLVSKGIQPGRISGKGYGGARPIASNASETTRKLNRRVEFKIIKN